MSDDRRDDGALGDTEPLNGTAPDPLEERAERRGLGRGVLIGVGSAVLAVLLFVVAMFVWGPWKPETPAPDNTVPVTTLPELTAEPAETLPAQTGTPVPSDDPDASPSATADAAVAIALSRWNWVPGQGMFSVGGSIGVVESGGTCTLTATNGGTSLQASQPALADVTTTMCVVNLVAPEATPGEWQLTMTYDGESGHGTSDTVTVTVT